MNEWAGVLWGGVRAVCTAFDLFGERKCTLYQRSTRVLRERKKYWSSQNLGARMGGGGWTPPPHPNSGRGGGLGSPLLLELPCSLEYKPSTWGIAMRPNEFSRRGLRIPKGGAALGLPHCFTCDGEVEHKADLTQREICRWGHSPPVGGHPLDSTHPRAYKIFDEKRFFTSLWVYQFVDFCICFSSIIWKMILKNVDEKRLFAFFYQFIISSIYSSIHL